LIVAFFNVFIDFEVRIGVATKLGWEKEAKGGRETQTKRIKPQSWNIFNCGK